MSINIEDDKYWCNKDQELTCLRHSYDLMKEPSKCIVCDSPSVNYTDVKVLHKPKGKNIIREKDQLCYTTATVITCNSEKCSNVITKLVNIVVSGHDWWDMYDEVLYCITLILEGKIE